MNSALGSGVGGGFAPSLGHSFYLAAMVCLAKETATNYAVVPGFAASITDTILTMDTVRTICNTIFCIERRLSYF